MYYRKDKSHHSQQHREGDSSSPSAHNSYYKPNGVCTYTQDHCCTQGDGLIMSVLCSTLQAGQTCKQQTVPSLSDLLKNAQKCRTTLLQCSEHSARPHRACLQKPCLGAANSTAQGESCSTKHTPALIQHAGKAALPSDQVSKSAKHPIPSPGQPPARKTLGIE